MAKDPGTGVNKSLYRATANPIQAGLTRNYKKAQQAPHTSVGDVVKTALDYSLFPVIGERVSQTNVGKAASGDLSGFKNTLAPPKGGEGQVNAGMGPFPLKAGGAVDRLLGRAGKVDVPAVPPRPVATPLGNRTDVTQKLVEAKGVRRKQEALYSQERSRRAAAADEAMKQGGLAGHQAALDQLKGELPKLRFNGFENFDQAGLDALLTHVQEHPDLRPYEKIRTNSALLGVLNGKVPTRSEIKLLDGVFGEQVTKNIVDSVPWHARVKHAAGEIWNVPRSLMASFDLSAPFRQGLMVAPRHPRLFFRNFRAMFRAVGSEKAYHAIHDEIASRPTFGLMQKGGLSLTELDGALSKREEQFIGNLGAERIPVVGHAVRGSGRAYTAFLNKTRADFFDLLVEKAQQAGRDVEDPKLLKSLATFVNSATGRGDMGQYLNSHAALLNSFFFSPRLLASRLNFLNPAYYAKLDPIARREAAQSAASLLGTVSVVLYLAKLGGAEVNTDPRNADFGKIKIGNTRLDILGGFQQPIRLLAQVASGKIVSSTTGKTLTLGPQGPGKLSRADIIQRFVESKMAPAPAAVWSVAKGTNFLGQPITPGQLAYSNLVPLGFQDARDQFVQSGPLAAAGGLGLSTFGVGVQTYGPKKPTGSSKKTGSSLYGASSGGSSSLYRGGGSDSSSLYP